jgi:hypothetical protein
MTPAQRAQQDGAQPAGSRIRLETGPDGVVIQYPNPSGIFPWAVGALLLVPAGALIGHPVVGLAAAVFVLGILLAGVVDHPRRVELRSDAVIVRRGLFGLRWDRRIARQDLSAVKHELQSGVHHTLDIELRGGDRCNFRRDALRGTRATLLRRRPHRLRAGIQQVIEPARRHQTSMPRRFGARPSWSPA